MRRWVKDTSENGNSKSTWPSAGMVSVRKSETYEQHIQISRNGLPLRTARPMKEFGLGGCLSTVILARKTQDCARLYSCRSKSCAWNSARGSPYFSHFSAHVFYRTNQGRTGVKLAESQNPWNSGEFEESWNVF